MYQQLINNIGVERCKNEFSCLDTTCRHGITFPIVGFDKPIYIIYDGKLCQAKIIRIDYHLPENTSKWYSEIERTYHLNVAGYGKVSCVYWSYNTPFSMFESVEDYYNGNELSRKESRIDLINVLQEMMEDVGKPFYTKVYKNTQYDIKYIDGLYQYGWDKKSLSVKQYYANIPATICYDGKSFCFKDGFKLKENRYATRNDAMNSTEVEIVTFDDDSDKTATKNDGNNIHVFGFGIVGKLNENDWNEVKEYLKSKSIDVF